MQGVLSEILSWAESQPYWLGEALRRLVEHGPLREDDIGDLIELCKQANESPGTAAPASGPVGLGAAPMPRLRPLAALAPAVPVTLRSIDNVENVNALAAECSLDFGERGLTVVYGENGSGKSGYARILKRACRARARGDPLRPNVFGPTPSDPPRARIRFKVGEKDQEFCWIENGQPHPSLGAVSFLDDECAAVHLDDENEAAYRPFGLELLEDLAGACRKVRETLSRELDELRSRRPLRLESPEIPADTQVARALASLHAHSSLADFERLATFGDAEVQRLAELRGDLDEVPRSAAVRISAQADRLRELLQLVEAAEGLVGDAAWQEFQQDQDATLSKRRVVELAASIRFSGEPLPGAGGEVWRVLWEAARRFSAANAYPAESFPVTGEGAVCVLCHQELGVSAADRLRRFEDFVQESTQRTAAEAELAFHERVERIKALRILPRIWRQTVAELRAIRPALADTVRAFLATARWRRWALLRVHEGQGAWPKMRDLPPSPAANLRRELESVSRRRFELASTSRSEGRARLESERRELESRRWLDRVLPDVQSEIERLKGIERLENAHRAADSTPVTRKSTDLAQELLTASLVDRFGAELERLRVKNIRVELEHVGGRYGVPRYQIRLKGAQDRSARCGDVLSEGERRVVALAGFLAELATAEERSALVLDDPVSSMDHRWRRLVAVRLAEEAADRQVIVFTHDVVFYLALKGEAESLRLSLTERHLRRQSNGTGVPVGDVPWIAMKTKQRIGWLKDQLQLSESVFRSHGLLVWEPLARDLYGSLREAWERAVEEVLLDGAVERFNYEVRTRSLKKVTDFTEKDYKALHSAMAKCSALMRGHDEAAAINEPVPEPDEVRQDIQALGIWVDAIRKRR